MTTTKKNDYYLGSKQLTRYEAIVDFASDRSLPLTERDVKALRRMLGPDCDDDDIELLKDQLVAWAAEVDRIGRS